MKTTLCALLIGALFVLPALAWASMDNDCDGNDNESITTTSLVQTFSGCPQLFSENSVPFSIDHLAGIQQHYIPTCGDTIDHSTMVCLASLTIAIQI